MVITRFSPCSLVAILWFSLSFQVTADTDSQVHLRGIVMPAQKVKMSFSQPGIVKLLASGGSLIKKGEVIAQLNDSKARAQLAQARAELRSAIAELASTEHSRDKNARLVEQDILSNIALVEAQFSVSVAVEKVAVAEAKLEIADAGLEACTVYAPFDGAVAAVNVNKGEWIKQGDPFIEFVNFNQLTLSIDIPPDMADGLVVGLTTKVLNKADVVGTAKVKTIFPVIDPASGLRRVVWSVFANDGILLSGRYVSLAAWSDASVTVKEAQ